MEQEQAVAFVVFDLETTGLGRDAKIVELCFVAFDSNGNQVKKLLRKVNPGMKIPAQASAVHGIYNSDVEDCPMFEDIVQEVIDAINWTKAEEGGGATYNIWDAKPEKLPLVGHNIVSYDLPILRAHFDAAGKVMPSVNAVDTLKLARARWPKHPDGNKLVTCCARMGIEEMNDVHSAEPDVLVNGKLYHRMMSGEEYEPTATSVKAKADAAEVLDILADFDFSSF